jgi:hypothetical protein
VNLSVNDLKKKQTAILQTAEEDLHVDLTLHSVSVELLEDFMLQVVKPYYLGNLSEAVKDLIQRALGNEEFVNQHIKSR